MANQAGTGTGSVHRRQLYDPVMRWTGAWSGLTTYTAGDVVSSGGNTYVCILFNTNNTPPNATYWQVL